MKKHIYYFRSKLYSLQKNYVYSKNFKTLKKNVKLKNSLRQKIMFKCFDKNFKINKNNIKKFCIFTGRLRSIVNGSKVNRLNFRELVSRGCLAGIFKK